jgi:hypothetical protein
LTSGKLYASRRLALLGAGALIAALALVVAASPVAARADAPVSHRTPALVPGPVSDELGQSLAVAGNTALVGAPGVNNYAGAVYVYLRQGGSWGLRGILTDPRNRPYDEFGTSIALDGTTAVIGAPSLAYVYSGSGANWKLKATFRPPAGASAVGDGFGDSVALSGNTALVGSGLGGEAGVYVHAASGWHLQATLAAPKFTVTTATDISVALSGNVAVIGEDAAKSVYVYDRTGTTWERAATLADPGKSDNDQYGDSVALSGSTIVVGARGTHTTGHAYFYTGSGGSWQLQATLSDPKGHPFDGFGSAVAIVGTSAVVGATGAFSRGDAYAYSLVSNQWQLKTVFYDPDHGISDQFGSAFALDSSTLLIGASWTHFFGGAAYSYVSSGPGWKRQGTLSDPRGALGADKGSAVAIDGSTAIVGAWGVNGEAGAAYIYAHSSKGWRLQATLKDPDDFPDDWFGSSVAVSGSVAVVGAFGADSFSGSAYVYARSGARWRLEGKLADPGGGALDDFGSSVAVSGSTVLIGADGANSDGAVWVYTRSGTRWLKQTSINYPGSSIFADFGEALAYSGGTAVIGASSSGYDTGTTYIYAGSGKHWTRQAALPDPDNGDNDNFGASVALAGGTVVIGAPGVHDYSGAAYVYARTGSKWRRQATLTVSRRVDVAGGFGGAVAVTGAGSRAVALVSGLSVSGLTLAKKQCGSAIEFDRPAGRWKERAQIADPHCTSYDEFGYALSISGGTALIGAPGAFGNAGLIYVLPLVKPLS